MSSSLISGHFQFIAADIRAAPPMRAFLARIDLIAVARKLLHAIYGLFRSGLKYKGTKLFPKVTLS